jgi:uncharacterized protein YndB with AHSA1/START domain
MKKADTAPPSLDVSMVMRVPSALVLRAFFDPAAIAAWWQAARSITTPRVLGPYAIEWRPSDFADDVLGRLGGVFSGTVMQLIPGKGFFVADAYWLPPDGDPIGPMALEVSCSPAENDGSATLVRVTQSGFEESVRWRRYYEIVDGGWERALTSMRMLLER